MDERQRTEGRVGNKDSVGVEAKQAKAGGILCTADEFIDGRYKRQEDVDVW
jgi:hypothetical protein